MRFSNELADFRSGSTRATLPVSYEPNFEMALDLRAGQYKLGSLGAVTMRQAPSVS